LPLSSRCISSTPSHSTNADLRRTTVAAGGGRGGGERVSQKHVDVDRECKPLCCAELSCRGQRYNHPLHTYGPHAGHY
jgi:hypothetical protein